MLLHDVEGDEEDRNDCILTAREIAGIIMLWLRELKNDELQEKRNSGNGRVQSKSRNGAIGPYVVSTWVWTADRLSKGGKILRSLGRTSGKFRLRIQKVERIVAESTRRSRWVRRGCGCDHSGIEEYRRLV